MPPPTISVPTRSGIDREANMRCTRPCRAPKPPVRYGGTLGRPKTVRFAAVARLWAWKVTEVRCNECIPAVHRQRADGWILLRPCCTGLHDRLRDHPADQLCPGRPHGGGHVPRMVAAR